MWGVNPRSILGSVWWNKEKKQAKQKSNFRCHACGIHYRKAKGKQWLEGHEQYDIDCFKGIMTYIGTVALCHYCHNFIHIGRMRSLLAKGQMKFAKYSAIIKHAESVLDRIGKTQDDVMKLPPIESWSPKWCLMIDGKKYTRQNIQK
jgi:hypothetical protein